MLQSLTTMCDQTKNSLKSIFPVLYSKEFYFVFYLMADNYLVLDNLKKTYISIGIEGVM
jgi:hypothetical protein